jgi:hypothetical protein
MRVCWWVLSGMLVTLCRVNYEGMTMETTVKANAGSTVAFNETLSFLKQKDRHIMRVLFAPPPSCPPMMLISSLLGPALGYCVWDWRACSGCAWRIERALRRARRWPRAHARGAVKQVAVLNSDNSGFNNLLAERVIDLSKLPLEDWDEFIENAKPVAFELKDSSGKSAGRVFLGFAGIPPAGGNRGDQIGLSVHGHHTHFDKAKFDFLWTYFDLHMKDEETLAVYRESVERSRSGLLTPESLLVGSSTFHCRVLEEEDSNDIGQLLTHSVVLRVLAWHTIRHFIPYTRRVKLTEGQTLRIIERSIVAVQWGSVKLTHLDASGAQHTVILGQNEVAGEAWTILNVCGISSVMANSQSVIVLLPWTAFGIWFEMQPKMVMVICAAFVNLVWKTSIDPSEAKFQPYEVEVIRAAYSTTEGKRRGGGNQQQRPVEEVKMALAEEDRKKDVIRKVRVRILQQTIARAFDSWREAVEEAAAARAEEEEQKRAVMLEELREFKGKSVEQQKIDEAIRTLMEHVSDACQVPWAKSPSKTAILAFVRWKASFMSKRRPRVESKEHERRMVLREGFRQIEGTWDVVANGASVVYLTVF